MGKDSRAIRELYTEVHEVNKERIGAVNQLEARDAASREAEVETPPPRSEIPPETANEFAAFTSLGRKENRVELCGEDVPLTFATWSASSLCQSVRKGYSHTTRCTNEQLRFDLRDYEVYLRKFSPDNEVVKSHVATRTRADKF